MKNTKKEKVRAQIEAALAGVHDAATHRVGTASDAATLEQLTYIQRQLERMKASLDGELPPRQERAPGLWHIITDSWPARDPLGEQIVAAELAYEQL